MLYRFRAKDGSEIEEWHSMHNAPSLDARRKKKGKTYRRVIELGQKPIVEDVHVLSYAAPFLTESDMRNPEIPKAKHHVYDRELGRYRAGYNSKREMKEHAKATGLIVE